MVLNMITFLLFITIFSHYQLLFLRSSKRAWHFADCVSVQIKHKNMQCLVSPGVRLRNTDSGHSKSFFLLNVLCQLQEPIKDDRVYSSVLTQGHALASSVDALFGLHQGSKGHSDYFLGLPGVLTCSGDFCQLQNTNALRISGQELGYTVPAVTL